MRGVNRIPKILNELEKIWKENPDLRLGQLILNMEFAYPLYFIEDKELIRVLKEFYKINN